MQTEWPLMKYLTFLHSVVKKRRTFGNIAMEDESNSPSETQEFDDLYKDSAKNLTAEDDSMQYVDYMYLDDETGIVTDIPSREASLQSFSNILGDNTIAYLRQETKSTTPISQEPVTSTPQRLLTPNRSTPDRPNISIPQRPVTPNTSTEERPVTSQISISQRPIIPNTSTADRPVTPKTSILQKSITPKASAAKKLITSNTSIPKRLTSQNKKESPDIKEQLGNAVDVFKSFVTHKNTASAEDESLKYFCDSLYGDLKSVDKSDLISCKIEIMQIISSVETLFVFDNGESGDNYQIPVLFQKLTL
ncbi:uncharacterized protein LOC112588041 [Harpegnathos saltator]|uniref:uncharacterized protein LOC112588041 n=1 Tax=Harpegnathos saltator TaxID=610380 RepID=UPI000DBED631|nr:uncharacterized protein LOC112588041 [Harpegnathos saltator]